MKHIYNFFRQNILAGILVTVPFAITLYILYTVGRWIVGLISTAPSKLLSTVLHSLPTFSQLLNFTAALLAILIIVLIIGAVARNIVGRKLLAFSEYLINKIPLARTIYIATKQIIETLMGRGGMKNLKRVAMFEYPRKGIYSIGFITSTIEDGQHHNLSGRRLVSIFVPTTPNPTSGYYIMLPEEDIKELSISVEDAFRIIMSAGLATNNIEDAGQSKKDT
ncbi:MAG: DUF502 domain-containing protein [Candidatus Dadabacteria bacterium]|nr:MAG: DUF502 domain-containing protein [Candidatus Dadabacteria bacterium]TDI99845.1 MAG: DUF502 domain-containing protein [Candidatus Dadabacteria bacterium]